MEPTFLTFERFNDPALAEAVAEKLKENGIEYRIEGDRGQVDAIIAPLSAVSSVSLQIRENEFTRANAILQAYYEEQLGDVDPDYFLYTFTDDELRDVLAKRDEWGHLNYALAKRILAERGK